MRICRIAVVYLSVVCLVGLGRAVGQEAQQDDEANQTMRYADESSPKNSIVFDVNGATAYDDNIFSNNANRVRGEVFQTGGHVGISEQRERGAFDFDYIPEFMVYTDVHGFNQVNHTLHFGAKYAVRRHFSVSMQDSGQYFTGLASPRLNSYTVVQGVQPSLLNNTITTPLGRELANEGRVDANYQMSRRSSFDFYGGVGTRNFSGTAITDGLPLINTEAYTGGVSYSYQLSASQSVGITAQHQNLSFGPSMTEVESGFATYSWRGRSGVSVNVFGGPEYARLHDDVFFPITGTQPVAFQELRDRANKWNGGGGVTVGWRSPRTGVQVTVQRLVTDGGGLLTSVTSNSVNLDIRRHLYRHWDLLVLGMAGKSIALSPVYGSSGLNDLSAGVRFERQLSSNLVAQLGYEAGRQRGIGAFPFTVDMNRNYVSLGFFYRIRRIPLGR